MLACSHEFTSGPTSHYWSSGRLEVRSADQRQRTAAADRLTGIQNIQDTPFLTEANLTLALESGDTYIAGEAVAARRLYKGSRPMGAMVDRAELPRRLTQPARLLM